MISRSTIDSVFETALVEEVIGDFIQLKRAGSNYKGLSPFTDERTPSFMVSPAKQIWKDFSSGKGGNVVSFLMEHEHFTYPEAIRYLAKKYGIEVEETEQSPEQKEEADTRESLYLLNEFAASYFHKTMMESDEGKAIGLSYFKERGFTTQTIETFRLGYSPDAWEAFTGHALKNKYKLEFLEKTGLTVVREDPETGAKTRQFDRFKGRVMFPIRSMSGRILGFGGRILRTDKKTAKYLNSPESEIYHKSKILYGIFEAKQSIAKEDNCYLVEGYTDVIQMHQAGIQNVVASSGTALTPEQIRLINRLTNNIVVLFDGDAAGIRAALRGVDLILEQGMNVRICTFPEGDDPDSFAQRHSETEIKQFFETNSKDFLQFKASLLAKEAENDPILKSETIHEIIGSIAKIADPIKRELYVRECARIMDVSEAVLFNALAQKLSRDQRESVKKSRADQKQQTQMQVVPVDPEEVHKVDVQFELEQKIIDILVLYGHLEEEFTDMVLKVGEDGTSEVVEETRKLYIFEKIYLDLQADEIEFTNTKFQTIYNELILCFTATPDQGAETFISKVPPEIAAKISDVLMEDERYVLHDWGRKEIYAKRKEDTVAQYVSETLLSLRHFLVQRKITDMSNMFNSADKPEDAAENLAIVMEYVNLKKKLSKRLNRIF